MLLADDEELARQLVRRYVRSHDDIQLVGECADGDVLALALSRDQPDLLLLDIRMPGADVFEVLREVGSERRLPCVVFATAYERYAIRAFEVNAIDYLLKPFTEERFAQAMGRVRERMRGGVGSNGLDRLIQDLGRRPDRLLVPDRRRMVPVPVADIDWIKAEGDYARIFAGGRTYLVSRTLTDLEERLDPVQFARVHRSAIVNTARIREVQSEGSSRYRVTLQDGTTLIVSRTRAPRLRRWMI